MYAAASFAMFLGVLDGWTTGEYRVYWLLGAVLALTQNFRSTEPIEQLVSAVLISGVLGMAIGLVRSGGAPGPVVAAIGDSTFLHAGMPALTDAAYNGTRMTVLILDNATTAMTGGQAHAAAGVTIRGDAASVAVGWVEGWFFKDKKLRNYKPGLTTYDNNTFMKVWIAQ